MGVCRLVGIVEGHVTQGMPLESVRCSLLIDLCGKRKKEIY